MLNHSTGDYRNAPSGIGPLARQWGDKPHWMLYDLATEIDRLAAECERHRRANLVRAVTQGVDPEWVADIIAAEGFDAVPWRIAAAAGSPTFKAPTSGGE